MGKNKQKSHSIVPNQETSITQIKMDSAIHYYGPIPHPSILQQYEQITPGSAKIIIEQFQAQSNHRMSLESKVIYHDIAKSYLGQIFGFIIGLVGITGSIYLVVNGHSLVGTIFMGTLLLSLVQVFVFGRKSRLEELDKKRQFIKDAQSKAQK